MSGNQESEGRGMTDLEREKAAEAYGWLWHITTSDERVKFARHCLFVILSCQDRGNGIKAAKDLGAKVTRNSEQAE